LFFVLVLVLVIEKRRWEHEAKRIEDENEYEDEYDDDIIASCVLSASL
jgi:hypothetical protein